MSIENDSERPLRILHLEDSSRDAEIIRERLLDAGFPLQIDWVSTEPEFTSFLQEHEYDLVLADYHLPDFEAPEALRLTQILRPGVPFICLSGAIGEEIAVELLIQGAVDYVIKDRPDRLPFAIKRAIDEAKEKKKTISARSLAEKALLEKIDELQRFQDLTVGRELTMIGLKKEVNELLKKSGQAEKYRIVG